MKLLLLSYYFTPDLCAGSFRTQALIDELSYRQESGEPIEVDLITTSPNRYATHKAETVEFEDQGWLRIHRIALPPHESGMVDQAWSFLSYLRGARALTKEKKWDLVFATSSRLMTAVLGAHIARRHNLPLYLDIRDLFTDILAEMLANKPHRVLLPLFRWAEKRAFRRACRINLVSEGFVPYVKAIAPDVPISLFPNGIDDVFLTTDFHQTKKKDDLPIIVYAGNMGEGQGLHRIVPEVAKKLQGKANFRLIGDGGKRKALEEALSNASVTNVELLPPVPRIELLGHYKQADFLFMHLNDMQALRHVLPSKVFEYGAIGKPILAGVAGYAAEFCRQNLPDAAFFDPLDADAFIQNAIQFTDTPPTIERATFRDSFARNSIVRELGSDILSVPL